MLFGAFDLINGQQREWTSKERIEQFLVRNRIVEFFVGATHHDLKKHYSHWKNKKNSEKIRFPKKLSELRIAIDPGHIGGEFSQLERRHLSLDAEGYDGVVKEGELTLLTALLVRDQLEEKGVKVFLTRDKADTSHLPLSFEEWMLANNHPEPNDEEERQKLFHKKYLKYDRDQRAISINKFSPHFTFIIHYDAIGPVKQPTKVNNVFSYVPGNFMHRELDNPEDLEHFKRLADSSTIETAIPVCETLNRELSKSIDVPIHNNWDDGSRKSWRREKYVSQPWWGQFFSKISTGVYSRNLHLTRKIKSPLCYVETLTQNHHIEFHNFAHNPEKRVRDVAAGYVNGILRAFQAH